MTRVAWWDGSRGKAIRDRLTLDLYETPPVPVEHLRELYFHNGHGDVRQSAQVLRRMTHEECLRVGMWLDGIAGAADWARTTMPAALDIELP